MTTSMNGGAGAVLFLVSAGDDDIVHTDDDHLRYLIGLVREWHIYWNGLHLTLAEVRAFSHPWFVSGEVPDPATG